jgi:hypothetical protein
MPKNDRIWSRGQLDQAREMWLAGKTATAIATIVGKSRGAVVGKMKRLGVLHRTVKPVETVKRSAANVKKVTQEPAPVPPPVAVSLHPVTLFDLKPHHCRAILGDVGKDGFAMYCADPKAEGSSYCAHHRGLFIQPLKERLHQWPSRPTPAISTIRRS